MRSWLNARWMCCWRKPESSASPKQSWRVGPAAPSVQRVSRPLFCAENRPAANTSRTRRAARSLSATGSGVRLSAKTAAAVPRPRFCRSTTNTRGRAGASRRWATFGCFARRITVCLQSETSGETWSRRAVKRVKLGRSCVCRRPSRRVSLIRLEMAKSTGLRAMIASAGRSDFARRSSKPSQVRWRFEKSRGLPDCLVVVRTASSLAGDVGVVGGGPADVAARGRSPPLP